MEIVCRPPCHVTPRTFAIASGARMIDPISAALELKGLPCRYAMATTGAISWGGNLDSRACTGPAVLRQGLRLSIIMV